jgi:hypothetical protein
MAETKKLVTIKIDPEKEQKFNTLMESIINDGALGGEFMLTEKGNEMFIFLGESGWNLTIRKNGTWTLQ